MAMDRGGVGLDRGQTARLGGVVLAEQYGGVSRSLDGRRVTVTAAGVALSVLVTVALSGGGVGYWGLRHWREFAGLRLTTSGRL